MKNCVYRLIGENREILYIGKAINLKHRLYNHRHLPKSCYSKTRQIEYASFSSKADMDFAEIYYISKYKPPYNDKLKCDITIQVEELDCKKFLPYDFFQKVYNNVTVAELREVELYVKDNSIGVPTKYAGKNNYRVHPIFFKELTHELEQKGIYTDYDGFDKIVKFGNTYTSVTHLIYSYTEKHSFYISYEEKESEDKNFMKRMEERIQSCDHSITKEKFNRGDIFTVCEKCGSVLDICKGEK